MLNGCWMDVECCRWLVRLHCAESPTKWKSRTVSMSIQAIYQSCLEIGQPIDSLRQSLRHSLAPSFSPSLSLSLAMHFWHFIDWAGNWLWQLATGERQQCIRAASPEMQIFNNISLLSPCVCVCVFYLFSLEYSNLKLTSCMWTQCIPQTLDSYLSTLGEYPFPYSYSYSYSYSYL